MFRESYDYYYLLGMSCLYTGDYSGSYSYLRRALDIDERPNAMLGLGAVLLRRRQTDQALRTYLDIIDMDNRNRRARRALQWLRGLDQPDEAIDWFESNRIRRILPPLGWYVPRWITVPVIVAAAAAIAVAAWPIVDRMVQTVGADSDREGSELVAADRYEQNLVTAPREERFQLTSREAERLLNRIGDDFNARRDNLVRRELNRIAMSNAAPALRERAELIRDYLQEPDFSSFSDNFTFDEVRDDPALHEGVYVRWRGRVANLDIGDDAIRFDFLAGYHDRQVLDGIVPARIGFAVLLQNDEAVELIGQVEPEAEAPEGFSLRITSIRRLGPSELATD